MNISYVTSPVHTSQLLQQVSSQIMERFFFPHQIIRDDKSIIKNEKTDVEARTCNLFKGTVHAFASRGKKLGKYLSQDTRYPRRF